jgi:protein-S-isoprenylcysteine O-methyltransferase Ste14
MTATTGNLPHEVDTRRGALVPRIPPPLYYGAGFAAGMLLNTVAGPLAIGSRPVSAVVGAAVAGVGVALALAGVGGVVRHRTTIVPHHPVATLITTGAYRISRNPMYTGLAIAYLGGALIAGFWWPLFTLPVVLLAVQQLVIRPEERYLAGHFGQTYFDYRTRARRWL